MKANDRVKSPCNTGTVKSMVPAVVIHWDGFAWPIEVPAEVAATFEVVGFVDPDELPEPSIGSYDEFDNAPASGREDFHSDG